MESLKFSLAMLEAPQSTIYLVALIDKFQTVKEQLVLNKTACLKSYAAIEAKKGSIDFP